MVFGKILTTNKVYGATFFRGHLRPSSALFSATEGKSNKNSRGIPLATNATLHKNPKICIIIKIIIIIIK